ncbi:LPD7 domain-containing protein [Pantoea septica]|uniref:LPD7 domain-containing protein n=1 Tax=Pantoea septica TaxID=472695 RepID=UPI0028998AD5|nr:LPD7 domain-containing protein [Pantoea septica]
MKTADYPVWLAVMPDQRNAARADAGAHPNGGAAIAWDKAAQLWYARPGADLSRLQKWMPDRSIRSSGGGDPQEEFLDALTSAGLVLDGLPVMDGRRHRVPVVEGKKGNRDGVYRGFLNGVKPGGWFINYHRADNDQDITKWKASGSTGKADPVARVHIRAVMRQSQDDAARKQAALYARQTASAKRLYDRLPVADRDHAYLMRKGITVAEDVRQTRNGALVVPFFDADGAFRTLQYIPPTGDKYLFEDAPKSGHFRVEGGQLANGEPILYAEGYATARSLHMVTGRPVVMTIDAGNMGAVATVLKARYPDSPHLFMADVDHAKEKNKGVLSANRAAEATGGAVLLPDLTAAEIERGFTDFNDLHQSRGAERLQATLLPEIARALEGLNYKDSFMATPEDTQPVPKNVPAHEPATAPQPETGLAAAPANVPEASAPASVAAPSPEMTPVNAAETEAVQTSAKPARNAGSAQAKSEEILALSAQGMKAGQIAKELGIGQTSVYRILRAQQADVAPAVPEPSASVIAEVIAPEPAVATELTPPVAENAPEAQPAADATVTPDDPEIPVAQHELVSPDMVPAMTAVQPGNESVPAPQARAVPMTPSLPAGPYDGFTGLYGTSAELGDRLAALASGQISPAALLEDIRLLRGRVDSAGISGVYTREHVNEMQQVFDRLTRGGMAGADISETGTLSRLRGLLGRRDTWNSMYPNSGSLDINTLPDRVSTQYTLLARGEVTRAQFDREVRMLYREFTRADTAMFAAGRHEATQQMFERMAALGSPERARQYAAETASVTTQLPPASPEDPNATALYRIQTALRDEFVSLVRGETSVPALTERLAGLKAQLEEAKAQGVYAESHVRQIEGAFDRLTKDGLAGLPSPDAPGPRGDYGSRNPASATLDVATVPARIEAQYGLLVRGEVTRSQFEDNLVVLRNEVARLSEAGRATPEALAAATGAFAALSTLSVPAVAVPARAPVAAPEPVLTSATVPAASSDAIPLQSDVPLSEPPTVTTLSATAEPVIAAPVTEASTVGTQVAAGVARPETVPVSAPADQPGSVMPSQVITPVTQTVPADASLPEAGAGPVTQAPERVLSDVTATTAEDIPVPGTPPTSPLAAASGEENAILVGAPRMAPSDEDVPAAEKRVRTDTDKLLSRITHEKQADGKSVLYKLDGEPAFHDRGNRLVMAEGASAHEEKVLAALLTAANHYHGKIELTGSDEFKAFAINLIVTNNLQVSMKNASQQVALDEARRAAGQPVSPAAQADAVRGEQQPPRAAETPPATPAAQAQEPQVPVPATSPVMPSAQPVSQAAPAQEESKTSPAVHTPAEKAREPVTGKVTACGQAPFRFDPDESESTFITLRTKEGSQTFWGKELAGLLRETNLKAGKMVTLQWLGKQNVTVNVPRKNEAGEVTHYEQVSTHRNQWSMAPKGGDRVQTGRDDMVPLSAVDVNRFTQIQHTLVSRLGMDIPAPPVPADKLYWLKPDGQGSSQPGDPLSAPRPAPDERAGIPVMSAWGNDGQLDLHLVQGDGNYLQGVVRQNGEYHHVLVSLPDSPEAPRMVINLLTAEGAQPIGSGNGINKSNGQPVPREHVVVRLTGDDKPRIAKLDAPAELPAALHARMGYDERYKSESGWVKEQPAAAPQAVPATQPRPAQ